MIVLILRLPGVIFPPSLTCSKLIVILHLIKQFVTFMFPMMQIVIPTKCWISTLFFISLGTDNSPLRNWVFTKFMQNYVFWYLFSIISIICFLICFRWIAGLLVWVSIYAILTALGFCKLFSTFFKHQVLVQFIP